MRKYLIPLLIFSLLCPMSAAAAEDHKYLALTFDDGPSGRYTQQLLDALQEREVRATFFLCGYRLEQYPGLAEQMAALGHEIGIHGYSHRDLSVLSRRDIAREISDTRALLPDCPVRFLRPPQGCCSDGVRQVAKAVGLSILSWSLDPKDWAVHDTAAVSQSILNQVRDGDVILLHDMSDSSVSAALNTIDLLKSRGFTFVTVSELARLRDVRLKSGVIYRCFPPED